jgi:hypothetical protein
MSMEQGEEAEPQVLAAAQMLAGLEAEQTSSLTCFFGVPAGDKCGQEKRENKG